MDTKSRKSHKLAKVIITLCVILPAVLLVSLYPTMEKAMLKQREYYENSHPKREALENMEWVLTDDFINYAVETSYWLYLDLWNETQTQKLSADVFRYYGWHNDFIKVESNATYRASYQRTDMEEPFVVKNTDRIDADAASFTLKFDETGNVIESSLKGKVVTYENPVIWDDMYESSIEEEELRIIQSEIESSQFQFRDNLKAYNLQNGTDFQEEDYLPKNLEIVFGLNAGSGFVEDYDTFGYVPWWQYATEELYAETGAYWLVALCVIFVTLAALLLPFIKGLNTGREKIFSIPFEITWGIGVGAVFSVMGMGLLMAQTTMTNLKAMVEASGKLIFLNMEIGAEMLYKLLLAANIFGWVFTFFLIYIVASNLRQLISHPKYYLKNQILIVKIFKWIYKKLRKLYENITDFDLENPLDKTILKVTAANFVVLTILCCMGFFGVAGLIVYSIALFVLMKKKCDILQKQYRSVLQAAKQMAEGDLKISMEEELGVFQPIGASLEKVQQGFEKAVVEEAKSQNMKTELITNVSHDLKTPLTAIITYVDLLKKENISAEERASYIHTLDQKSQRLKVLIEDLFEVSKAHSGNIKMNFMDVDVVNLLKQVRSEMSDQIEESNLSFRWNLPEERVVLSLDGQRMYRVFENLLHNILKYAMPYSRAYIDIVPEEECVQILFRNVSAMELDVNADKLTERFVRGDESRKSEGSGLGLAIAKSFIELQKGDFEIQVDGDLFKVLITFVK